MPMLGALDELVPWLNWCPGSSSGITPWTTRMGVYFEGFLLEELRGLERPRSELADWRPWGEAKWNSKTWSRCSGRSVTGSREDQAIA